MAVQDPNNILSAIDTLITNNSTAVPAVNIPALNFTVPTDLPSAYQDFLKKAAQSPDIIAYYDQLLNNAKGDLTLATTQLKNDYDTGVRQVKDTLAGTLQSLGLTFTGEQQTLADTLNKRGIALTDMGGGKTAYAAGGQPATELGNLNDSQVLRQEAEQRSASQNIENSGLKLKAGMTTAGQTARNTVMGLQSQKQSDIYQRANIPYQQYLNQQNIDAQKAVAQQQGGGGGKQSVGKGDINPSTGKAYAVNPSSGVWDDNYFAKNFG